MVQTKTRIHIAESSVSTIESFFKYSDIEIIKNPELYFSKNEVKCNFDAILNLDGNNSSHKNETLFQAKLSGVPEYGINRFTKNEQTILLKKSNINIPDTWFTMHTSNCNDIVSLLNEVKDSEKLILKFNLGARGLGQILCTKRELIDLLECDSSELHDLFNKFKDDHNKNDYNYDEPEIIAEIDFHKDTLSKSKKLESIDKKNKQIDKLKNIKVNYHSSLNSCIKGGTNFIIQRYIENRDEWRMLWFYDLPPIVIKRNVDEGNWQANACNNNSGASVVQDDLMVHPSFSFREVDDFCKSLSAPFLSIDIYYDQDSKKFGIFEFQAEFGWTNSNGIDSQELHKKMIGSVKNLINKK